ncbi:MAG: nitrophenyl compound nitroreductase subunit ArsF family protein [Patescibacteria group bacterium]|nr:nitrophenyl compound nitroreductase subunit ArsF family protein [Patescibacteria group bacterium]MDD4303968.1 nitrophenyl compound nitroreductase subunit ArsF family protein [Patescibacteria group bacterium]MDD4695043.1 nitrophenyl compound nitroreductase subunit ArsF family protein [Patescibacteria group bacterium]
MKKIFIIPVIILLMISITGCSNNVNKNTNQVSEKQNIIQSADKVQVYVFHATQRCYSCITIGRLSKETVEEYFKSELESGKIEFKEINIDLPENKELAKKFQASGSSLFINSIYDDKENIQQDLAVWKLVGNGNQFKIYLKGKLDNILGK